MKSLGTRRAGGTRIWRSWRSDFYHEEALNAAKVYTGPVLREIAAAGFNAIWIRGILHDLAPTSVFPELGRRSAARLRSLRTVIRRGQQAGVRVFLYVQPPLGFPKDSPFWKQHPEARGAVYTFEGKRICAMCTSEPKVRYFLRESAENLSRSLPGLGGVILITASERISHCYCHYNDLTEAGVSRGRHQSLGCPRCERRRARDIVNEIIGCIRDGLRAAGRGTQVVAWNWSWNFYEPDPQRRIIERLPRDVTLLADFERGDTKVILGRRRVIDEYSLSFAGPSRRFVKSWQVAHGCGLEVWPKLQLGTTHELATVPNLPLIGKLYDKAAGMRRLHLHSFMGSWNFGTMVTANPVAFLWFLGLKRLPPRRAAMEGFARRYFPGCDASCVARAWETFERAMDWYPYCTQFLYFGPVNHAVALPIEPGPLRPKPVGPSWMESERGDDLAGTFGPYTLEEITRGLRELTARFEMGAALLEAGLAGCRNAAARQELNTARVAGHCFHSAWNICRAYPIRKAWTKRRLDELLPIIRDERDHLAEALPIVAADQRMGFHIECQAYLFTAAAIRRKLRRLDEVLEH